MDLPGLPGTEPAMSEPQRDHCFLNHMLQKCGFRILSVSIVTDSGLIINAPGSFFAKSGFRSVSAGPENRA